MASIATATSIAALRSTTGAQPNDCIVVLGYYVPSDGGGGNYRYDSGDVTSSDNGGSVIVANDGKRWKLLHSGRLSVKQFGAKGDGVSNDAPSIQKAASALGAGILTWPPGTYLVTSALTMAASQAWEGVGGQRASTIKKSGNFDLITMGDLCAIRDLNLECQGGSYSGRGIVVSSGYSQEIRSVRIRQSQGVALRLSSC